MRTRLISVVMSVLFSIPAFAQNVNTDSIKAEIDKIEITNPGMKQVIENYKKGVIKGDLESETQLGLECISGKYVKANVGMGLFLLEDAANQNHADAQNALGNLYFELWAKKPTNDNYFTQGVKWLRKAVRAGDNLSRILLARFYCEYGKYKKESSYVDGGIKMLESYPNVAEVNNKDEQTLNAQALLGTACLSKWRMDNDTIALRDAKKWYKTLLKSELEFPNFTQYIDSLKAVLSMGVPMRLDPMPTPEEIEASKQAGAGQGGFGGFGGGGFGGGFPGGGMPGGQGGGQQGPRPAQATFPGGNAQMQQFVRSNTNYPENLKNQKINGRATVSFTIDTDGAVINPKITNHAIVNDVEIFIMDQEALRTVMVMPDWIPADQDGKPVQAQHSTTVTFGSGGGMGGFGFGF